MTEQIKCPRCGKDMTVCSECKGMAYCDGCKIKGPLPKPYKLRPLLLRQLRKDIAANPIKVAPWRERNERQIAEIDMALGNGGRISVELAEELREGLVKAWEASRGDYRRKYWSQLERFDEQTGNRVGNEDGEYGPVWD